MKNSTRQVVILDNFSSPYIHQAILILKDYNPSLEDKVIEEAERVVSRYLSHPQTHAKIRNITNIGHDLDEEKFLSFPPKKRSKIPLLIWAFIIAGISALVLPYII